MACEKGVNAWVRTAVLVLWVVMAQALTHLHCG
jgi:hypothetical protein